MRYSKQREIIYKKVLESSDHPDAQTIYERVKNEIPNISLGTVYRNLNTLVDNNKIRKVSVLNDSDRFDKTLNNHYHFYCTDCHQVTDIKINNIDDINKIIVNNNNITINNLNILVDGICHKCKKERG